MALVVLLEAGAGVTLAQPETTVASLPSVPANPLFGFSWVNGAGYDAPDLRYRQARDAGAGWTRWAMYWHLIETEPGRLDDTAYAEIDRVVDRDVANGLRINAVLLGTPGWSSTATVALAPLPPVGVKLYQESDSGAVISASAAASVPQNLFAPVFLEDGSINPDNRWGWFVYTTVQRYKDRIDVWEMWNEPDLKTGSGQGVFWVGSREDYYQLLKVGYLAAKKADRGAKVLFGGLAYWSDRDFFPQVLDLMRNDPTAPANDYYFDAVAFHLYVSPYHLYDFPIWAKDLMASEGLGNKEVWINEANLPVCDDVSVDSELTCPSTFKGTMEEQASWTLQALALGVAGGADVILGFQLYDDAVAPHEWYGFIRNDGTPRPAYTTFQVASRYLRDPDYARRVIDGPVDRVVLEGTPSGKVTVVWNRTGNDIVASIPAAAPQATLVDKYGVETAISSQDGVYRLRLPAATYRDQFSGSHDVGGDPFLILESVRPGLVSAIDPLPASTTSLSFRVDWSRHDELPAQPLFDVQYRVGEVGTWTDWRVGTSETTAVFGPSAPAFVQRGQRYQFRVRARGEGLTEAWPAGLCGCDSTIAIAFPFSGIVVDNAGKSVWGATIEIGADTMTSNHVGRFSTGFYPAATYRLAASKAGYGVAPPRSVRLDGGIDYRFYLPPSANALQNWSFEGSGGVEEWWTAAGPVTTSTVFSHSGAKSARLGEANYVGASRLTQSASSLEPNQANRLALMYTNLGTPAQEDRLTVSVDSASGGRRSFALPLPAGEWRLFSANLSAFSGATSISVEFVQAEGSTARVFVDGVSLGPSLPLPEISVIHVPGTFRTSAGVR